MLTNFSTRLGYMALATADGEVVSLTFGYPTGELALQSLINVLSHCASPRLHHFINDHSSGCSDFHSRVVSLLKEYSEGEPVDFADVPTSVDGLTSFQKQVVAACRAIAWGETSSYGDLARAVGHPGAARAVGTVMRKNRMPLIVPCHRVLASGGRLGGYSSPAGLDMKRRLLTLEGCNEIACVLDF